jgi:low temperature requirement protein LtrA
MNSSLTFLVFFCAFSSTVLMWWIYFDYAQQRVSEKVDGAAEPEKIAQSLFNYGHLPIVAGIILTAVGEDFSLSHSYDEATLRQTLAIIGGPVLFLAGAIGVKIASAHMRPVSHFVGISILVGLLFLPGLPLYLLQIASAAVLLMVAIWEYLVVRRRAVTVSAA